MRRRLPDAKVALGVGRIYEDPLALGTSFTEARRALAIGRWSRGAGQVSVFANLGLGRLLVGFPAEERAAFCESTLGPLLAYDARHTSALVETLDCMLATRNAALAARRLFVHYNTLKNRLDRIEEILGPVFSDPDRSLALAGSAACQTVDGPPWPKSSL